MERMREISGIYFRAKRDGKFTNVCFEELTTTEQDEVMKDRDIDWVKSLAKQLAQTINKVGQQFNIVAE